MNAIFTPFPDTLWVRKEIKFGYSCSLCKILHSWYRQSSFLHSATPRARDGLSVSLVQDFAEKALVPKLDSYKSAGIIWWRSSISNSSPPVGTPLRSRWPGLTDVVTWGLGVGDWEIISDNKSESYSNQMPLNIWVSFYHVDMQEVISRIMQNRVAINSETPGVNR